nr:hypothetical protein [uncultured Rhodoferax sp.]
MPSTSDPKYFIRPNLSEKQIESDVSTFMGWSSPDLPFRLKDISEPLTGSDKLFDQGCMIYMQFKKSFGLHPIRRIAASKRKTRSPLEGVREFRHQLDLDDDPTLFFRLHRKAATAADFQHNILLTYERPEWSRAIYVAPLTTDKEKYEQLLFDSTSRYLDFPFYYELRKTIHHGRWKSIIGATPYLRAHVCIAPHESVATHEHYFAYSENGTDISWHSPSVISQGPSRLSDFYSEVIERSIFNEQATKPLESLAMDTLNIARQLDFRSDDVNQSPLERLRNHAKWLNDLYAIKSFVFLTNSEKLIQFRNKL